MKLALNNLTYDVLNRIVKYVIPAIGTAYFTIAQIWNLPYGEEVVGTLIAISALLGVVLAVSNKNYEPHKDGGIDILMVDGLPQDLRFSFEDDPTKLHEGDLLTLEVGMVEADPELESH